VQNLAGLTVLQGMTAVGVLGALHMDVITDIAWSCDGRTLAVSVQLDNEASIKRVRGHKLVASCKAGARTCCQSACRSARRISACLQRRCRLVMATAR
jgi:hypothetical protein